MTAKRDKKSLDTLLPQSDQLYLCYLIWQPYILNWYRITFSYRFLSEYCCHLQIQYPKFWLKIIIIIFVYILIYSTLCHAAFWIAVLCIQCQDFGVQLWQPIQAMNAEIVFLAVTSVRLQPPLKVNPTVAWVAATAIPPAGFLEIGTFLVEMPPSELEGHGSPQFSGAVNELAMRVGLEDDQAQKELSQSE